MNTSMQPKTHNGVKIRKCFLLLLLATVFPIHSVDAQFLLDSCLNMPRKGDCLMKQRVTYKQPGDKGVQKIWDIRDLNPIDENYELKYSSLGENRDHLVGIEHSTMYYYQMHGDSLLLSGYENPTTLMKFHESEVLLIFPFAYGCVFTDYFDGIGSYCNRLNIHVQGKSTVSADATGMLLLSTGDTLRHVMRVHTQKDIVEQMRFIIKNDSLLADSTSFILNRDSINWHLAHDSICIRTDTWRWYAEGYRYPVFESIKSSICALGKWQDYLTVSFYYPPQEQYYGLEDDLENRIQREKVVESGNNFRSPSPRSDGKGNAYEDDLIRYSYELDSEGNLQFHYVLMQDADVTIGLYDLQGRQLTVSRTFSRPISSYSVLLPLSENPSGKYLLRISVGDKVYGEKIIK
ncbi:T9SS type A sorting domain-containing protein [Bacteroides sp. K03]|uniref:T9SS type A sorting domain-containing protein n=1 Tax=Bacteroides sp. K03 TaxID=2718928 RepID=UPI001C8C3F8E|nr:T9SS type A sorting domain-containing protein [Bacteroides sp. K03]MBX9188683.1 T9SS type A sorting domain-containing protein [Bacteroides sp. K03]